MASQSLLYVWAYCLSSVKWEKESILTKFAIDKIGKVYKYIRSWNKSLNDFVDLERW